MAPFTSVLFYHFAIRYTATRVKKWLLPFLYIICFLFIPLAAAGLLVSGMQIKPYGYAPIFGLAGIFIGVGLTMGGKTMRKINDKMSTWVPTERLLRPLDKIIRIDDWFYQNNILSGILLILACLLINLRLWLAFD